jgi:NAD(P) transhydrogenase
LSGFRQRTFYGRGYVLKDRIAMSDLTFRAQSVMLREVEVIKAQLRRNYVTALSKATHDSSIPILIEVKER